MRTVRPEGDPVVSGRVTPAKGREGRYDVLFEPVQLGPVRAKNRFVQVPHCNGMGYRDPTAQAAMRRVKAEGGWAIVSTEEVEIHPLDVTPYIAPAVGRRRHSGARTHRRRHP